MADTKIILTAIMFYTVLIVLMQLAGFVINENVTDTEPDGLSILNLPSLFVDFLSLNLILYLPNWLNTIIFLPLIIVVSYEVLSRLIRGS